VDRSGGGAKTEIDDRSRTDDGWRIMGRSSTRQLSGDTAFYQPSRRHDQHPGLSRNCLVGDWLEVSSLSVWLHPTQRILSLLPPAPSDHSHASHPHTIHRSSSSTTTPTTWEEQGIAGFVPPPQAVVALLGRVGPGGFGGTGLKFEEVLQVGLGVQGEIFRMGSRYKKRGGGEGR